MELSRRARRSPPAVARRLRAAGVSAWRPRRDPLRQPLRDAGGHLRLRLDRRHRGPDQYRRDGTAAIGYYLSNSGACLFAIEAQFVERLAHVTEGMELLRVIWVIGAMRNQARASMEAMPPRGDAIAAAPDQPRRHACDHLHQRHHRSFQGRDVPACAILLVGRQLAPPSGRKVGRRALHDAAAVPHQRAQHFCAGAALWRDEW